jgi:hypothetical protein
LLARALLARSPLTRSLLTSAAARARSAGFASAGGTFHARHHFLETRFFIGQVRQGIAGPAAGAARTPGFRAGLLTTARGLVATGTGCLALGKLANIGAALAAVALSLGRGGLGAAGFARLALASRGRTPRRLALGAAGRTAR